MNKMENKKMNEMTTKRWMAN